MDTAHDSVHGSIALSESHQMHASEEAVVAIQHPAVRIQNPDKDD